MRIASPSEIRPTRPAGRLGPAMRIALLWAAAAVGAVALRPIWGIAPALLPPCALRAWLGIPCPSCGGTRAALALLHGHLGAALAWNPLLAGAGILFLGGGVIAPVAVVLGIDRVHLPRLSNRVVLAALAVAIVANWVYLLLTL